MKKFLLISVAVLAVVVACNKAATYRMAVQEQQEGDLAPVPMEISTNVRANVAAVKGAGTVEAWSGAQQLRIFALPKVGQTTPAAQHVIKNIAASSPASGTSGAIDVYRTGTEKFYYAEKVFYDFCGYYVDNAANPDTLTVGTLKVEIDGTQDILAAKASPRVDTIGHPTVLTAKTYGATASRNGVKPTLKFNHQLSKLNFKIIAGSSLSPADAAKITVKQLTVTSKYQGDLKLTEIVSGQEVIVDSTALKLTPTGSPKALDVHFNKAGTLVPISSDHTTADYHPTSSVQDIGVPLMIMPGESVYNIGLKLNQTGYSADAGDIEVANLKIDFAKIQVGAGVTADTEAVAGHSYDVTITIHGLQQIDINVELVPWENAGGFGIDPDDE